MDRQQVLVVALIVGPAVMGLAWLFWSFDKSTKRGDRAMQCAKSNPESVERIELVDGDPTYLRIKLKGEKPATVLGMTPVECVRVFDEFKSAVQADCVVVKY